MAETYGTRPFSWYADQAPDYLDGEEEDQRRDEEERQRREDEHAEELLEGRRDDER